MIGDFADVHVAQFGSEVFVEEHIGTFEVPVHNVQVMQGFETPDHLDENTPDVRFLEGGVVLLVFADLLEHVSVVSILHHYTKMLLDN